jgi:hypothetical protein
MSKVCALLIAVLVALFVNPIGVLALLEPTRRVETKDAATGLLMQSKVVENGLSTLGCFLQHIHYRARADS